MKISIISPCYNAESNLVEMIESVMSQDYTNFELIIVNDGSTDNSQAIIESFQQRDTRILLINQVNSGKPSIARNNAIKASTGEILCFLDADDTMLPGKLSNVAKVFQTQKKINFVCHDFLTVDQQGHASEKGVIASHWQKRNMQNAFKQQLGFYLSVKDIYEYFLSEWVFLHVNTVALRKDAYKLSDILFDETLLFAEDINKWCELSIIHPFIYIDQPLATYRDTPNSLMKDRLKADIAAVDFISQHLHCPLTPISKQSKQLLSSKLSKEIKDVLYLLAKEKKLSPYWHYSKKLIKQRCSISHLFFLLKNLFSFLKP